VPSVLDEYRSTAIRYRPRRIQVLFLAESPPAFTLESKRSYFFFEENLGSDLLFCTLVDAVLGVEYRKHHGTKPSLLRQLQSAGIWLIDAVEYPINRTEGRRTSDSERRAIIEKESTGLLQRIGALRAERCLAPDAVIVLIKSLVFEILAEKLRLEGYNVPQKGAIGFPRYHRDRATIHGIKDALANSLALGGCNGVGHE
jgi:hypothetical protein